MATLNEISFMILEMLRAGHVVDDERLDLRLIKDWIDLKRSQYIKNQLTQNPNSRLNLNLYQTLNITVAVENVTDNADYPYSNATTQLYKIVESSTPIPSILEGKTGPIIFSLESQDKMKLPFQFVDYDYMRFAGNGKFNTNLIFGSLRDNKIYFKYNTYFDTYTTVILKAVFENPRDITGFNDNTTEYPANAGLIEYIKNGILDMDAKSFIINPTDEINDASGVLNTK